MSGNKSGPFITVNQAFSRQASHFDEEDMANPILQDLRKQVYNHVEKFIKPKSKILELNAGTGIDALHFIDNGHVVHAIDLSDGMIEQIQKKINTFKLETKLTYQQLSFDKLNEVPFNNFDYVFSNFGGLNCIDDLSEVTKHLPALLKSGAFVTWVIMPPLCPWELAGILKGNVKTALRRFTKGGVMAHLEGQYFNTYYHSLSKIKRAFGKSFTFVESEGLAALSPPPYSSNFQLKHQRLYQQLRKVDEHFRKTFPFDRWGDHIIVTFQFTAD